MPTQHLYPGGREQQQGGGYAYSLDDAAMVGSMAEVMEVEMENMFLALKGKPLPPGSKQDRRLLFAAIARGILQYLNDNQVGNVTTNLTTGQVSFNINMDTD